MSQITILGIYGSLRKGSFNMAALKVAQQVAPSTAKIVIYDKIGELPLFNQDEEQNPPQVVKDLKAQIRAADAILFSSPEYNYSVPGVLKNAIDWASRPYGDSAWEGKPAAIMGAAGSMTGTARMQYHLRQMGVFLNLHFLNRPEVMIPTAHEKFDAQGNITDEHTKEKIKELVEALVSWTEQLKG